MDDYVRHLFAYVDSNRLRLWSCGHIVPSENLFVWPVVKSPKSIEFDFTFKNRNSSVLINALGDTVLELSTTIPDGMVVFFPSYAYLDQVILQWQKAEPALSESIWDTLSSKKPLYRESKDTAGVEDILQEYTKAIDAGKGGILLSVIGGKMSEGINFSDRLGRCVVVVGLPFPNILSAQWKAKLEYIEQRTMDGGGSRDEGKAAGREFYENACMRAVNQSIGRAVRHRNDFASIVLLDRRYRSPRIADKLPGWIKQGMVEQKGAAEFRDVVESLGNFFRAKNR
jgi:chromosome transmission fidelity protein 1